MKLEKLKNKDKVTLAKVITIADATALKDLLLEPLADGKNLSINASKVESIDTLCCQVILSAKMSFKENNLEFEIVNNSKLFDKSLDTLGLTAAMMEV